MSDVIALFAWKSTFSERTHGWTREIFVVAPTIEQATELAKTHPPQEGRDHRFIVSKCERLFYIGAVWQPPQVIPKRPTDEQVAALEVERLLGEPV